METNINAVICFVLFLWRFIRLNALHHIPLEICDKNVFIKLRQIVFIYVLNIWSWSRQMWPFKLSRKGVTGQIRETNTLFISLNRCVWENIWFYIYISIYNICKCDQKCLLKTPFLPASCVCYSKIFKPRCLLMRPKCYTITAWNDYAIK